MDALRRIGSVFFLLVAVAPATSYVTAQELTAPSVQQAMHQGTAAMTSGQFESAVAAYRTVTHLLPGFAEGFLNLGLAEERAGQLDEAKASLQRAVNLKPGIRGAHLFLGTIAYKRNHFAESEEDFVAETRVDPRSGKAFMWLGVARLAEDRADAAIGPLDHAHELDPTDVDTLYHRGRAYFLVANASYADMFKIDPDSFRVHQMLAESAAEAFRTEEAIHQYETAIQVAPRQPGLHEELADQYWTAGNLDKAATTYQGELEIDPTDTLAKFKLGSLYVVRGKSAEGVPLLRQAIQEDPSLRDAHYYLGDGLLDLGDAEEAVREYQLAIAQDPGDERAMTSYYRLSQAYKRLHQSNEARAALADYLKIRDQTRAKQASGSSQIARKRSQLPVADPVIPSESPGKLSEATEN
jgi:protein O-GlcNAc transferase